MQTGLRISVLISCFMVGTLGGAWLKAGPQASGTPLRQGVTAPISPSPVGGSEAAPSHFASDEQMLAAIMAAAGEKEPLRRAHLLRGSIGSLSPRELSRLFTAATHVENVRRREDLLRAILRRWFAIDSPGAEVACRPYLERWRQTRGLGIVWNMREETVADSVHSAWTAVRPEEALAEAFTNPNTFWAMNTVATALPFLGGPADQLRALEKMPEGRFRTSWCTEAIKALAATDTDAAMAALDLLSKPRERVQVEADILGELAKRDPSEALSRLCETIPDLPQGIPAIRMLNAVLRATGAADPENTLAAIDQFPPALQHRALAATLIGWAGKDPIAALDWAVAQGLDVNDLKSTDGSRGWQTMLLAAGDADNSKVVSWLSGQPPSPQLDSMLQQVLFRSSRAEADQIYAQMTPAGQVNGMPNYMAGLLADNPESAAAWVNAQPAGPVRSAAITALVEQQTQRDPDLVKKALGDWPPGADQDAALSGIAISLFRQPQLQVDYVRQISDPQKREATYVRIFDGWALFDPNGARTWLDSATDISTETRQQLQNRLDNP